MEMSNLLSYCGLVDARISASDKYLPVRRIESTNIIKWKDVDKTIK